MLVNKILKVVLLILGAVFLVLQGFAFEVEGAGVSALMLVLLTILYCRWTENKSKFFFGFLVTFTFAHLLSYFSYYDPLIEKGQTDYYYYGANLLYMVSYVFLIFRILRDLDLKAVSTELSAPIVILVVLDVFFVSIVSGTTENALPVCQYALEYGYNAVIMILLSVTLINYMYRIDNKSMLFLVGAICIVFSEIIQLAHYYILQENNDLGFIWSFFLVVAFLFLYLQSQIEFTGPEPVYIDE